MRWLPKWMRRARFDSDELGQEIEAHRQLLQDALERQGRTRQDARTESRRRMGNETLAVEDAREAWTVRTLDALVCDGRFCLRTLRRDPLFAVTAILTLALGIGTTTALFSVAYGIALKPLPYPRASALVSIGRDRQNGRVGLLSLNALTAYSSAARTLEKWGACRTRGAAIGDGPAAEHLAVQACVGDPFGVLGTAPEIGRAFSSDNSDEPVAVLSHAAWMRRFNGSAAALGSGLVIDGRHYEVIGVMPESFSFPYGRDEALWIPAQPSVHPSMNRSVEWTAVGRLRAGSSVGDARNEAAVLSTRLPPDADGAAPLLVAPMLDQVVGRVLRVRLTVLSALAALVSLIAAINVASLLLARSAARQRELATRAAIGAGRARLVRQLLTESSLLGVIGGAGGLLITALTLHAIVAILPPDVPRRADIAVDGVVFLFAAGVSLASGFLAGLLPAIRLRDATLGGQLKEATVMTPPSRRSGQWLVFVETTLALLAVVAGGLMVRSFARLSHVDPGVDARNVIAFGVDGRMSQARELQLVDTMQRTRGVTEASAANLLPFFGYTFSGELRLENRPDLEADPPHVDMLSVQPRFFATIGTPLLAGRDFSAHDVEGAPPVAILNETAVRRYFPGRNPIGQRVWIGEWREIVGVVRDAHWKSLADEAPPFVYLPFAQNPHQQSRWVVARVSPTNPPSTEELVWRLQAALPPGSRIELTNWLEPIVSRSIQEWRFEATLLGSFAVLALVLSLVGIFGVTSFSVHQRRYEVGVRRALGARPRHILAVVARDTARPAIAGLVLGIGLAMLTSRVLASMLYGISALDPATYVGVAALFATCAAIAVGVPSARALRQDPMATLRDE